MLNEKKRGPFLALVSPESQPMPSGVGEELPPVIREEVPARARLAGMTIEEYAQYAGECLEGFRFPNVGDTWLRQYCRSYFTLRQVMELYQRYHLKTLKNPASALCRIRKYFKPLYPIKLGDLTRQGVTQWYAENAKTSRIQATGSLKTLRAVYNKAIEWELYEGSNPASGVKKFRQFSRTRFIQPGDEMDRALASLVQEPDEVQAFFLLCLLCACRSGEARSMKWGDVDLTKHLWHKPMTKTGIPHTIPLPDEIVGRLKALPQTGAYVFGSSRGDTYWPATTAHYYWSRIRRRANLNDVTIHDLRRTWASWAAMDGENLAVISKVLNHSNLQHTQIYARLNAAPMYRAINKQAQAMMKPNGSAEEARANAAQPVNDPFGQDPDDTGPAPSPVRPRTRPPAPVHKVAATRCEMEWPG
jgi:integrase